MMLSVEAESIAALKWQCRRGMLELDVLLTRYLENKYFQADEKERALFKNLLQMEDPVLYGWFTGQSEAEDPSMQFLVNKIRRRE